MNLVPFNQETWNETGMSWDGYFVVYSLIGDGNWSTDYGDHTMRNCTCDFCGMNNNNILMEYHYDDCPRLRFALDRLDHRWHNVMRIHRSKRDEGFPDRELFKTFKRPTDPERHTHKPWEPKHSIMHRMIDKLEKITEIEPAVELLKRQ